MKEYIFTFGFGQVNQNGFFAIMAENADDAREQMNRTFGNKWSMMYSAPDAREKAGVEFYNLKEVK